MRFRALRADEIECRIGTVQKDGKGVSLLLYKDARCDMKILDETVGSEGWQSEYYEHKGTLFCRVGIKIDDEWIWKANAGSPSNMESVKGEASDAFKRACFTWGIGRELYTAPFIWVPKEKCQALQPPKCFDRFFVSKVAFDNGSLTELEVKHERTGEVVFTWSLSKLVSATLSTPNEQTPIPPKQGSEIARDFSQLTILKNRLAAVRGITPEEAGAEIVARYGNPKDMDDKHFEMFVNGLKAEVATLERGGQ